MVMHAWMCEYICVSGVCARVPLTVSALHLCVVACFYKANVSQVEDACNDLQHLSLDVTRDPNHLHGFLETTTQTQIARTAVGGSSTDKHEG